MDADNFHYYLRNEYRGVRSLEPLGIKPANDAVSRCNRIEHVLGINLDQFLKGNDGNLNILLEIITKNAASFNIDGNIDKGIASIKNAAKRYHEYGVFSIKSTSPH